MYESILAQMYLPVEEGEILPQRYCYASGFKDEKAEEQIVHPSWLACGHVLMVVLYFCFHGQTPNPFGLISSCL